MSPPINILSPDDIKTTKSIKIINKYVSLTNLNAKLINLNESRLSLDDKYLPSYDHIKSDQNELKNASVKTLEENLDDDMIGLGSLSSTGSNIDSLKQEIEDLNQETSLNRSTSRADTGIGSDLLSNVSTSPIPHLNTQTNNIIERNNSLSTSDDLSDFDDLNFTNNNNKFKIINDLTIIYTNSNNNNLIINEIDQEESSNRRDTIIFVNNSDLNENLKPKEEECEQSERSDTKEELSKKTLSLPSNSSLQNFSCEVASLSSVYSNYSQFDFLQQNRLESSPPPLYESDNESVKNKKHDDSSSSSSGLSSILNLFANKKQANSKSEQNNHSKKFDLLTTKFFNFNKKSSNCSSSTTNISNHVNSNSALCLNDIVENNNNCGLLKQNHSINDLKVPDSVLIFENRPSNLPAKSQQEALKHRQEYEKMIEAAKKKELKEKEMKLKKYQQQIKKEDFMTNSLRIWNQEIIPNWNEQKNSKRTHQLWWHGLPPSIRGKIWKLAIGNELELTTESYYFYEKKAKQKLELISKYESNNDKTHESSVELIKLDVSRTFPQLSFFQKNGPYHEALHNVLGAYACYNTQIGYVQGMSFLTAILLLNMEAIDAFICLANLLNTKILLVCFCMDQAKMNRYFRVHQILFEYNIPKLYRHFEDQNVKPDLYLIEWIFTLFSKSLPLDVMSRVWDVFFRDQEEFLFRTALGILNLYKDTLLEMDFIHIVQFLTKLPDNINSTQLFKSIEQINMCIDDITFENLVSYNN